MAMTTSEVNTTPVAATRASKGPGRAQKIKTIAVNTFRESVRDRVLYNLILFVLIIVGASVFVSDLSIAQESKFIVDLGLGCMLTFGALIAIFIGVGLVFKEIDKRTIYNLLSKPVHRHEFIIGKYFGLCMTLFVNSIVMVLGTELALLYVAQEFSIVHLSLLPAAYLIYLKLALLVAVALMFSSFSTPLLSALFSFAAYVIGHFSNDLRLAAALSDSSIVRGVLTVLYYLLPNFSNFSFAQAARGRIVPAHMILSSTIYAVVYISLLLSAAVLIFQKRNFK